MLQEDLALSLHTGTLVNLFPFYLSQQRNTNFREKSICFVSLGPVVMWTLICAISYELFIRSVAVALNNIFTPYSITPNIYAPSLPSSDEEFLLHQRPWMHFSFLTQAHRIINRVNVSSCIHYNSRDLPSIRQYHF